jgi:galactose mutarotase-like enzyme
VNQLEKTGCRIIKEQINQGLEAITIENELLSATVLPGKGAEIYSLTYKNRGMDVLWKAPWEARRIGTTSFGFTDSTTAWLEHYGGGWQEIFPNVGDECTYKGVNLSFHGEASLLPWSYEITENSNKRASISFKINLYRSPFKLIREMTVQKDEPILVILERVLNLAAEDIDFVWGHHPAFGAPFLSEDCVVDTSASTIVADDRYDPPSNVLPPAGEWSWPIVQDKEGNNLDISRLPRPQSNISCLAYLKDFTEGWYSITNRQLGMGVGIVWPEKIFPYAYLWIESHASYGFPFYGRAYTVAIEPFSSFPGQGLINVMNKTASHLSLGPSGEIEVELRVVFFEADIGVSRITQEGTVEVKTTG